MGKWDTGECEYLHRNSKPPTKALLIGINYDAWPVYKLKGCHADVENAKRFLLKIGVERNDIRILTDRQDKLAPTREAILEAFDWLKEGAQDGDVLFLHYSGHGVETDPPRRNPLRRASSKAIAPIDMFHRDTEQMAERWDYSNLKFVNPITGEDFKRIFGHFEGTGINFTVVYDCCHSTGAMRALGASDPEETPVRGIRIPEAEAVHDEVVHKTEELGATSEGSRGLDKQYEHRYSPAELVPPYVIGFAAAQGWEPAIDARIPSGPCGAFSHFFYGLLNKDASRVNGQGIIASVNKALKKNRYSQTPSLTTTKKNVPLFVDFTARQHRGIGDEEDEASLSAPRSIDAESLPSEQTMINRAGGNRDATPSGRDLGYGTPSGRDVYAGNRGYGDSPSGRDYAGNRGYGSPSGRDVYGTPSGRDVGYGTPSGRDLDASRDVDATAQMQHMVDVYTQVASSRELQAIRAEDPEIFDACLKRALPIIMEEVKITRSVTDREAGRDIGTDRALECHVPTIINLTNQLSRVPEFEGNPRAIARAVSENIVLTLNTARSLADSGIAENENARSLLDSLAISAASSQQGDLAPSLAPAIIKVASAVVRTLDGQRSVALIPTDERFIETVHQIATKILGSKVVHKMTSTAHQIAKATLNLLGRIPPPGVAAQLASGPAPPPPQAPQEAGEEAAAPEPAGRDAEPEGDGRAITRAVLRAHEAHVRGIFDSIVQIGGSLLGNAVGGGMAGQLIQTGLQFAAPMVGQLAQTGLQMGMNYLQGGQRPPQQGQRPQQYQQRPPQQRPQQRPPPRQKRDVFDDLSRDLPDVIRAAEIEFRQQRGAGSTREDEVAFLHQYIARDLPALIEASNRGLAGEESSRGLISYLARKTRQNILNPLAEMAHDAGNKISKAWDEEMTVKKFWNEEMNVKKMAKDQLDIVKMAKEEIPFKKFVREEFGPQWERHGSSYGPNSRFHNEPPPHHRPHHRYGYHHHRPGYYY